MGIIELLDPAYVKSRLDNLDISLTTLRDAIRGTGNKTLTDLDTDLLGIKTQTDKLTFDASNRLAIQNPPNLDVLLSTRASESTLSGFSGKFPSASALSDSLSNPTTTIVGAALLGWDSAGSVWERVYTDGSNRLKVQLDTIPNPSNLDVALSTRATESTLSSFSGKFPSAVALSDSLSNPTTTIVGDAMLGFDGTNWRRVTALSKDVSGGSRNAIAVIASLAHDITRMPYMVENISVTTTESSTSIAAPGAKIVKIANKGDVDVLIGINASVPATNPLKIRPRTIKVFMFGGATTIYYKTASGSSTIDIEWWN